MASTLSWKWSTLKGASLRRWSSITKHSAFRAGRISSQISGSYSDFDFRKTWTGNVDPVFRSMRMPTRAGGKYCPPATVTMPVPENRDGTSLFVVLNPG